MGRTGPRVMFEGLVAGLLAYLVVAGVYAVADLLLGRPLFTTPALIGSVLFYGQSDAARTVVSAGPVAAANGLHVLIALLVGMVAAVLAEETERHPQFFYVTFLVAVLFLLATSAVLLAVPSAVGRAAPWTVTLIANLAGAAAAGAYLWRSHPALRASLDQISGGEDA